MSNLESYVRLNNTIILPGDNCLGKAALLKAKKHVVTLTPLDGSERMSGTELEELLMTDLDILHVKTMPHASMLLQQHKMEVVVSPW